jgi:hypothetical protein
VPVKFWPVEIPRRCIARVNEGLSSIAKGVLRVMVNSEGISIEEFPQNLCYVEKEARESVGCNIWVREMNKYIQKERKVLALVCSDIQVSSPVGAYRIY